MLSPGKRKLIEQQSGENQSKWWSGQTRTSNNHLADGLEGLEGLHISSDGHGTGPLGHSLGCHNLKLRVSRGLGCRAGLSYLGSSQLHSLGHLLGSGVTLPWLLGVDGEQDHLGLELLQPLCVQLQRLHALVPEVHIF